MESSLPHVCWKAEKETIGESKFRRIHTMTSLLYFCMTPKHATVLQIKALMSEPLNPHNFNLVCFSSSPPSPSPTPPLFLPLLLLFPSPSPSFSLLLLLPLPPLLMFLPRPDQCWMMSLHHSVSTPDTIGRTFPQTYRVLKYFTNLLGLVSTGLP